MKLMKYSNTSNSYRIIAPIVTNNPKLAATIILKRIPLSKDKKVQDLYFSKLFSSSNIHPYRIHNHIAELLLNKNLAVKSAIWSATN